MTAKELRQKYLEFFKSKNHAILSSAPLIPENDPTVLFTTAGMHPLVPYLMGEPHPEGRRVASAQKCLRTDDIEEVGDKTHHTFFEMLGNWSLGDYFKKEAINWSYEFLTKELQIPHNRLAVSVFKGDEDAPLDEESIKIWKELGIKEERIAKLPKSENWWGPAGATGPCGPDSEMFYWSDDASDAPEKFDPEDDRWVEIWNDVFMEYNKVNETEFVQLKQKNVDTGMGLERMLAVLKGLDDDYQTDLFLPIIKKTEELSGKKYKENKKAFRVLADHIKAAVFLLSEKLEPSNTERGYILRRLIRRAIRYSKDLDIEIGFTQKLAEEVVEIYKEEYPEVIDNKEFIFRELHKEEEKFNQTLEKGEKEFQKIAQKGEKISAKESFNLYQTYGFPLEMTKELADEHGLSVDEDGFKKELEKHQELSRTAAAGKFKSGLADHSEQTTKYHTATHLLLASLRQVLGKDIEQRGSNITSERLRFDFSYPEKLTDEQIKQVEELVNQKIKEDLPVVMEEMSLEEAKKRGILGVFDSKYGEKVKVYYIGDKNNPFSAEICAGPHVEKIGCLGTFKITKEESSSSGVRRIKAVLE